MLKMSKDVIYLNSTQSKRFEKVKARKIPSEQDWWAVEIEGALIPMTSLELYAYVTELPRLQNE